MMIFSTALWALACAAPASPVAVTRAQSAPTTSAAPAGATDFAAEYKALLREFEDAQDAYYEPYSKAKTDEERAKVTLDPAKEPTATFTPRFQDLAARAKGTDTGARALVWIVANTKAAEDLGAMAAVDELLSGYASSPLLEELVQKIRYATDVLGLDVARQALVKIGEVSPHQNVRAGALFAQAALQSPDQGGTPAEAKKLYERVAKEFASTPYAAAAKSALFEIEHLQIGMAPPDFQATDEDGKPWRLSEYRGKVVVLDFWGFW